MKLEILTPEKMLFSGEVDSVTLPGAQGLFTVLPSHAPLISSLQPSGKLTYLCKGDREMLRVTGGFVKVWKDIVTVCTESGQQINQEKTGNE